MRLAFLVVVVTVLVYAAESDVGSNTTMSACPACYRMVIDLNTWNPAELQAAIASPVMRYDGVWSIPQNSPGVSDSLWQQAYTTLGVSTRGTFVSEEYGTGNKFCQVVSQQAGFHVTGSFQYHETGFDCVPGSCPLVNNNEINQLASQCGAPVIALTRAFSSTFGGGDWINQIGAIVGNPNLLGIAWEFIPGCPTCQGMANMAAWINGMQQNGKQAILLWGFCSKPCYGGSIPLEQTVVQQIRALRAAGAHLDTPNVWMVITRYQDAGSGGAGYTPIMGGSGSIQAITSAFYQCRQGKC